MKTSEYEKLLKRIDVKDPKTSNDTDSRFAIPPVDVMWEGQRTILRNFSDYPKIMRRDPSKVLQYLSKEFAVPAEKIGDTAMFIGKREPDDFTRLFKIYVTDYIECQTCKSPDLSLIHI